MDLTKLGYVESAGTPRQMGEQYGEQAAGAIRFNVEAYGLTDSSGARKFDRQCRLVVERHAPELLEEMAGIAAGAEVDLTAILRLNQVNHFHTHEPSPGCTTMAIRSSPEGPILGKNNDGDAYERCFVIRRSTPQDGLPMIQVTYAGWINGLDAMNSTGLVVGHNSVGSSYDRTGERIDIRLWSCRLMRQCSTVDEFVDGLQNAPLTGKGFAIVAADAQAHNCVVEAALPDIAVRNRNQPFIYATNHFLSPQFSDNPGRNARSKEISTYRFGFLEWQAQTEAPSNRHEIEALLADRRPWAPCRYAGPHRSVTLWSMIGCPQSKTLYISEGPPDCNAYVPHTIARTHGLTDEHRRTRTNTD